MIVDMGQNNRRYGKIVFYIPEKGMRRKGGKIVGEGKYLEEKKTEREKEENIGEGFFFEEKEEENIWRRNFF